MADNKETPTRTPRQEDDGSSRDPKPTLPVDEEKRLKDEELRIEMCTKEDMLTIAMYFYMCFPESFFARIEPPSIRDGDLATRAARLAQRLTPTLYIEKIKWIKAVHVPTGQIAGAAGWMLPGLPIHNPWRHSATAFYGFDKIMNWTETEMIEMWRGVDIEAWEKQVGGNDDIRTDIMGEEEHWFLAPIMTLSEYRGRGVATKLINWATEQADSADPVQPMYLESAPTARNMYVRFGFEPVGEANFLRRGPGTLKGVGKSVEEKVDAETVEKEVDSGAVNQS